MFCEKCGKSLNIKNKYCAECGHLNLLKEEVYSLNLKNLEKKWYFRFVKVVYIFLYVLLLSTIIDVWNDSISYHICGKRYSCPSYGKSFLYSVLVLILGIIILRLIKLIFLYIVFGIKPEWEKELKKFF